jgi:hypothetical protein
VPGQKRKTKICQELLAALLERGSMVVGDALDVFTGNSHYRFVIVLLSFR